MCQGIRMKEIAGADALGGPRGAVFDIYQSRAKWV